MPLKYIKYYHLQNVDLINSCIYLKSSLTSFVSIQTILCYSDSYSIFLESIKLKTYF